MEKGVALLLIRAAEPVAENQDATTDANLEHQATIPVFNEEGQWILPPVGFALIRSAGLYYSQELGQRRATREAAQGF